MDWGWDMGAVAVVGGGGMWEGVKGGKMEFGASVPLGRIIELDWGGMWMCIGSLVAAMWWLEGEVEMG